MKIPCYIQQSHSISILGETETETVDSLKSGKNCFTLVDRKNYPDRFPIRIMGQLPSLKNLLPKNVYGDFKELKRKIVAKLFANLELTKDVDLIILSGNNGANLFKYKDILNGNSSYDFDSDPFISASDFLGALKEKFPGLKFKRTMHFVNTCSSGTAGVAIARSLIGTGRVQNCLIINFELTNHILTSFFSLFRLGVVNTTAENFESLFLSFSKGRSGFVKGDALAVVHLVGPAEAEKNPPIAKVIGAYATSDCYSMTDGIENGSLIVKTINGALQQSQVSPANIELISSHGSGTVLNDQLERMAFDTVFRDHTPYLSALKAQSGHTLACASLLEIDILMKIFKNNFIPANLFYEKDEEVVSNLIIPTKKIDKKIKYALKTSLGFGGYNAAAIFENIR